MNQKTHMPNLHRFEATTPQQAARRRFLCGMGAAALGSSLAPASAALANTVKISARIGENSLGSTYHSPQAASATWQALSRFADNGA